MNIMFDYSGFATTGVVQNKAETVTLKGETAMLETTPEKLQQVAQEAFDACQGKRLGDRWQRAIAKAKQQLESNPYIHLQASSLLILSPDSLTIYEANGTCQCKAYRQGWPCWHRAAYRLAKLAASH